MKKRIKIKLSLNSQTVRRLSTPELQGAQGGWVDDPESLASCYTAGCTVNGRGCG